MMLDWAVSILVVSLVVFGLVAVSVAFFQNVDHNYVLESALTSTSHTVADQVDRVEGIAADVNQAFYYNQTVTGSGSSYLGVPMPGNLAGSKYTVDFTHDFVVTLSNGSGPSVGSFVDLTEPVVLVPENMTHQWEGQPFNGYYLSSYHLHTEDAQYNCWAFPSGVNFNATVAFVLVDGAPTYLTFVYAMDGMGFPCA
jgi:hypothetical protein